MENSSLAEIIKIKTDEIAELRNAGAEPFPHRVSAQHSAKTALEQDLDSEVSCAGRVVQLRLMGKAAFVHIQDRTGKIQIYVKNDAVGADKYEFFKKRIRTGDFVSVKGKLFLTKTSEKTIHADEINLIAKSIRPMPEKWHGLQDTEIRFRSRHLDLMANETARKIFTDRSKITRAIRKVFDSRDFLEVETPVLCASAGGASATPFETFHNALGVKLSLRIATELYLKRLIIGGMERVYEIGKIFRNEGIDTRHNPEFTMLEAYQAYTDYHGMAELFEAIITACAEQLGIAETDYRGYKIPLKPPFRRLYLPEMWKDKCGEDIHNILEGKRFNDGALQALARRLHIGFDDNTPSAKIFERIFDAKILPLLGEPAFVMDHPTAITPLAKCKPGDESLVERFEFFAGTEEIANAYTELNDPIDQMGRLTEQMRQKSDEKNNEVDTIDKDFVVAMESGMPPTGGIGIGIDRLTMFLTGNPSIREVILFPTMKPEANNEV